MRRIWLLVPFALAGCVASTPLLRPDVSLPPSGGTSDIRLVSDPPKPAEPLKFGPAVTLDQAVHACLTNDPRLRAAFENVNQAVGDLITASLVPNPVLTSDFQFISLGHKFVPTETGGPPQTDHGLSWQIDWFLFGKRAAAMASRGLGVKAAESDYANAVRQRVTDVSQAFYDVLEARELLAVARRDVENLRRVEAVLQKGVAAGGKARVDLSRVRLDLANSRRTLREAESTLASGRARLRALLGRADGDPAFDVVGELQGPDGAMVLSSDESFALAQQSRPDVQARRDRLAQSEAELVNQERKAYPQVTPNVWYTRQFQRNAIGQPDAESANVQLQVTIPVFDRNQGERHRAASNIVQSKFELDATLVELRSEIETVLQELLTAEANAKSLTGEQLKLAAEVRDNITTAFQAGGRTLLEVLDANRTYNETFRASVSTRAAYRRALYRYYSVIGRQVTTHDAKPPAELPAPRPAG